MLQMKQSMRSLPIILALSVLSALSYGALAQRGPQLPAEAVASIEETLLPGALASGVGVIEAFGEQPLGFEENLGQTDARVRFLTRGAGSSLFLTAEEAVMVLRQPASEGPGEREAEPGDGEGAVREAVLRMRIVGANPEAELSGLEPLPGKSNYLTDPDPQLWLRGVSRYARVRCAGVYPGVDLIYHGNQRLLEYDFVVAPNCDPGPIRLAFSGADPMTLDEEGNLILDRVTGGAASRWLGLLNEPFSVA